MELLMFSSLVTSVPICKRVSSLLKNKSICHIPAYYSATNGIPDKFQYYELGFRSGFSFPLGVYYDKRLEKEMFECDAIHIGGGNTFELLCLLRSRGLIPKLQKYVRNGGILIGTSAGSIVMCPSIEIAGFADDNYLCLTKKEMMSLGLVEFDMKPHWEAWEKYDSLFCDFAKKSKRPLFCLKEGQMLRVTEKRIEFFGGNPTVIVG